MTTLTLKHWFMIMSDTLTFDRTYIFFDGRVVLRDFYQDDIKLTMGYMAKGEFKWLADKTERFTIVSGLANFIFDGKIIPAEPGSIITVPEGKTFTVNVSEPIDYRCYYG